MTCGADPTRRLSAGGPGDIIDSTLFDDGFIGYSAFREDFHPRSRPGLRILR